MKGWVGVSINISDMKGKVGVSIISDMKGWLGVSIIVLKDRLAWG